VIAILRHARALQCLLLAFAVLFAQQAAQLHALAHAQGELARPHKGKVAGHAVERCIAFQAVGSALTSNCALEVFEARYNERAPWFSGVAPSVARYRLPARAPPQAV